jgi:monoamine oxidase
MGIDFEVFETRDRLGGRILSVDNEGLISQDGFDLGPSWFWPHVQPRLAALVQELGLTSFFQNTNGDVIFERMSREKPARYRATDQDCQSMRIVGGTGALVRALSAYLEDGRIHLRSRVTEIALCEGTALLKVALVNGSEYQVAARQVIAAVPPRLLATVSFAPELNQATLRRWHEAATWMAPHAKFVAVYQRPFWREAGLCGTAQSFVGPMAEIHDATTSSGKAALMGFVGMSAEQRLNMGESFLLQACVDQLARLFGSDARFPSATLFKDWADDPNTATPDDRVPSGHPPVSQLPWVSGDWEDWLSLASSETSETEPGYLAGAIHAAEHSVSGIRKRLEASR